MMEARNKARLARKKVRKGKRTKNGPTKMSKMSIDQLLEEADKAMEQMGDPQTTHTFLEQAVVRLKQELAEQHSSQEAKQETEPAETLRTLVRVYEKLGELRAEYFGNQEGAKECFSLAIEKLIGLSVSDDVDREQAASLYLYLGQLCSDYEALEAYEKGIQHLEDHLSRKKSSSKESPTSEETEEMNESLSLKRQLASAYSSVAELYMTDLCFAEDAEGKCERAVIKALEAFRSVDALQSLASLRLSQGKNQEASEHILAVYSEMKRGCDDLAALVGLGDDERALRGDAGANDRNVRELIEVDAAQNLPGYEFRTQTARILLECTTFWRQHEGAEGIQERSTECATAAVRVLGSLLAENDSVIETWYLTGCALAAMDQVEASIVYWERALEMLLQVKENGAIEEEEVDGEDVNKGLEDQIEEVNRRLNEQRSKLDSDEVMEDS